MEALQREIARKRTAHASLRPDTGGKKYFRRGDMEAKRVARAAAAKPTQPSLKAVADADTSSAPTTTRRPAAAAAAATTADAADSAVYMEPAEVKARLRKLGQVVTYFAETDQQREARLRKIETTVGAEVTDGSTNTIGMLLRKEKDAAELMAEAQGLEKQKKPKKEMKPVAPNRVMSTESSVRAFLKRLAKEWREDLDSRGERERASSQGKTDSAYYEESMEESFAVVSYV